MSPKITPSHLVRDFMALIDKTPAPSKLWELARKLSAAREFHILIHRHRSVVCIPRLSISGMLWPMLVSCLASWPAASLQDKPMAAEQRYYRWNHQNVQNIECSKLIPLCRNVIGFVFVQYSPYKSNYHSANSPRGNICIGSLPKVMV